MTFSMFNYVAHCIGEPPRPLPAVDLNDVNFGKLPPGLGKDIGLFEGTTERLDNAHKQTHQ